MLICLKSILILHTNVLTTITNFFSLVRQQRRDEGLQFLQGKASCYKLLPLNHSLNKLYLHTRFSYCWARLSAKCNITDYSVHIIAGVIYPWSCIMVFHFFLTYFCIQKHELFDYLAKLSWNTFSENKNVEKGCTHVWHNRSWIVTKAMPSHLKICWKLAKYKWQVTAIKQLLTVIAAAANHIQTAESLQWHARCCSSGCALAGFPILPSGDEPHQYKSDQSDIDLG